MRSKAIVLKIFSLVSQYYKTKSTQWRPKLKKKGRKNEKNKKKILNETKSNVNSWKETIKPFFAISTIFIQTRANLQQHGDKNVEERKTLKLKQLERILISLLLYNILDNFEMIQRITKG